MKLLILIAAGFTFLTTHQAYSSDKTSSVQDSCSPSNYATLVKCAEKSSADIQISNQKIKSSEKLEDAARQWVNPEIEIESISKDSDTSEQAATLFFNISLGGKRSAEISEAVAERERSRIGSQFEIQNFRLSLMLALYRISHLQSEVKIEDESVATFTKIINQFQSKAALSPEQDVSLSVFKMALADHQLSLVKLKSEFDKLTEEISINTGFSKELILKSLPKSKNNWPKIENNDDPVDSPQLKIAQSELNISKSLKSQANADSWPELKVGPTIQKSKADGESETLTGFSLSMPLPVFSWNGGVREYSSQRLIEAEMNYEFTKKKTVSMRKQLVNKYLNLTSALTSTINSKSVSEKHEKIERQFFRGIVPSSLIIEAHRQLYDLESKRNESELEALESFGQILILDNKFSEVTL